MYLPINGTSKGRVAEVLKVVGLEYTGRKPVKKFSLGMKQRLSIALALLPNPELLILDEPSNGLDPGGIIELRELVKKLNKEIGMTILISSHILSEVEKMVSHLGIIYKGRMLFQGTIPELHKFQQKSSRIMINTSDNETALKLLQDFAPERDVNKFSIPFQNLRQVAAVNRILTQSNLEVYLLHP